MRGPLGRTTRRVATKESAGWSDWGGRRRGNERDATSSLDPGAGQKTPSARPECEQRRHYCRGPKPNHFCGTSQGKHTEASIEKDCEASQTDLIRRHVELGLKAEGK